MMNANTQRDVRPKVPAFPGGPCCLWPRDEAGLIETGIEHHVREHGVRKACAERRREAEVRQGSVGVGRLSGHKTPPGGQGLPARPEG